jgi:hypothetical protein
VNATTNGPRITCEHIAAVLEALTSVGASEQRGALTKAGLSLMTGLPSRVVEGTVEVIRRDSIALVASGPDGYWLPATLEEAEANVERRHSRALTQLTTIGGERTLIRRLRDAEALTLHLDVAS